MRPFKFLCLGVLALLALALAPAGAGAKVSVYSVTQARLDVQEVQTYKSTTKVSWRGEGDQHEGQKADDPELPSLPIGIPASGGGVSVLTDRIFDGVETLVDAEGKKESCSGDWEEEDDGAFSVRIKPKGNKLETSWDIPHGFSSHNCGAQRDLFPARLIVKSVGSGSIGDHRLVLETKGTQTESRSDSVGSETQTVKWKAKVVLTRVTTAQPTFPGKPPIRP